MPPKPLAKGKGGLAKTLIVIYSLRPKSRRATSGMPRDWILYMETKMPKMKTKAGAKKRFVTTGTGKFKMRAAGKRHMLRRRSTKMKRQTRGSEIVKPCDAVILRVYMPYHR